MRDRFSISRSEDMMRFREDDNWITLPVSGATIGRCVLDFAFSLDVELRGELLTVRISAPFELTFEGRSCEITPEVPSTVGAALCLFNQTVSSLKASNEGVLMMEFATPARLVVGPQTAIEAWEIVASAGLRLVALTDGQLAKWQGKG
jgi:hypothetical protein